ncbi:MAG: hypothetical protein FWG79_02735 [Bacteroidales bacterium]|nr:hypothetical protein [Bacteroidales bacterium]
MFGKKSKAMMAPRITTQPQQNFCFCEGEKRQLTVFAEGSSLTYQWQRLIATQWQNISGNPKHTFLTFQSNPSATGIFRVIVLGACCSDTSVIFGVTVDRNPVGGLVVINDTLMVSGIDVPFPDSGFLNPTICLGDSIRLGWDNFTKNSYLWCTGETSPSIQTPALSEPTNYNAMVVSADQKTAILLSFTVHIDSFPPAAPIGVDNIRYGDTVVNLVAFTTNGAKIYWFATKTSEIPLDSTNSGEILPIVGLTVPSITEFWLAAYTELCQSLERTYIRAVVKAEKHLHCGR